MRCFLHADSDAVAICRYCGKGLCRACAVEAPDGSGVSCGGPCAEWTSLAHATLAGKQRTLEDSRAVLRRVTFLLAGAGLAVSVGGSLFDSTLALVLGIGLIVLGLAGVPFVARSTKPS